MPYQKVNSIKYCKVQKNGRIHEETYKPNVPRREEKPILGLKTNKNFIIANAVENILAGIIMSLIKSS
jgi:hypothetical protein